MKLLAKNWVLASFITLSLLGCGGIREESKVATAVQSMMVLAVEAAVRYNTESIQTGTGPLECSEGGTYEPKNATLADLIKFITGQTGGVANISGEFEFNDCVISLCETSITLNGQAAFTLSGVLVGNARQVSLSFASDATNQIESAGIISGSPRFEYKMEVDVSENSLGNILIIDANPALPLEYKGKVYRANKINDLAKGC